MTEEEILYSILNTAFGSQLNDDLPVDEREVRYLMMIERSRLIIQAAYKGFVIDENNYQLISGADLTDTPDTSVFSMILPQLVQVNNFKGIRIYASNNQPIPMGNKEDFLLHKGQPISKFRPFSYLENNILYIYSGETYTDAMSNGSGLANTVSKIKTDKKINVEAIFLNPESVSGYNWTKDPYPIEEALISPLKDNVLKKSLLLAQNMKIDEVANMKNDNIRYHDQGKID